MREAGGRAVVWRTWGGHVGGGRAGEGPAAALHRRDVQATSGGVPDADQRVDAAERAGVSRGETAPDLRWDRGGGDVYIRGGEREGGETYRGTVGREGGDTCNQ